MLSALMLLTLAALAPSGGALACSPAPATHSLVPGLGHLSFRSYGAAEGLGDLAATLITQDEEGFLWVGTQSGGLFRYDGARFKAYGHDEGLPSALVRALVLAPDGSLWVGTSSGLAVRTRDRFEAVGPAQGLGAEPITAIAFDRSGQAWVGTTRGLFRRSAGRAGHFEPAEGWTDREISALLADEDGSVLVASDGQLAQIRSDGKGPSPSGSAEGLDGARIISIIRDVAGRLWVKSVAGLRVRPRGDESAPFVDQTCLLHARRDSLLSLDRAGNLLVPTGDGLLRVRGDAIESIDKGRGLPSDFANYGFEDREGSLWIASVGVHQQLGRGLWSSYGVAQGLPNNIVWSIARAPGSDAPLYAGTENGLARATPRGWETVPGSEGLTFGGLQFAADGGLWSTGSTAGILRLDPATGALDRYGANVGIASSDITLQVAISGASELWVSTRHDGLYEGDLAAKPLHLSPFLLPGAETNERVNQIVPDAAGRLWFAGARGLAVRDHDQLRRFTPKDGLRADAIGAATARRNGEICVAYRGHEGVTCFRYAGQGLEGVHDIDVHQGHRGVQFLGEDAGGRLWAGTASGVSVVSDAGVEIFGTKDGTPGDDSAELAFLAEPNGDVWIGTSTGLGRFDGSAYRGPPAPPAAVIVSARFGERPLAAPFDENPGVPYGRGSLAARFSALSFLDESRLSYETRLLGADETWQRSEITQAQFGALAPGRYRFEVRARYGDGSPGSVAHLSFQILPAWWQSWWFRGFVGVVAISILAGGVRLRVRALNARNAELEDLVAARTADLERAHQKIADAEKLSALGRMLAQLSHELNNPVNVISNNIEPLSEYVRDLLAALGECRTLASSFPAGAARVEEIWESLEVDFKVGDIASVIRVVSLAANRISTVHSDLRTFMRGGGAKKTTGDIAEPLRETVAMMRTTIGRDVTLSETYGDVPAFAFDRGRMNQVFLNLLQNAIEATGGRGEIRIETRLVGGEAVEIAIADTGPGVATSVRSRIFEPFFTTKDVGRGTGLGLAICRTIVVGDHGGTIELDQTHEGGARFVVRLPIASAPDAAAMEGGTG